MQAGYIGAQGQQQVFHPHQQNQNTAQWNNNNGNPMVVSNSIQGLNGTRVIELEKMDEYRLQLKANEEVKIELEEGQCELFGQELSLYKVFRFYNKECLGLLTYTGCKLLVQRKSDEADSSYICKDKQSQVEWLNIHDYLQLQREKSRREDTGGPVVMVVGSPYSGKSTACRTLLNYANRQHYSPIYVDLEVNNNTVGHFPGTIGAVVVDQLYPLQPEGFLEQQEKVVLLHGYPNYQQQRLYLAQVEALAQLVQQKYNNKPTGAGVVINGPTYSLDNQTLFIDIVRQWAVDLVCVLDQDNLLHQLKQAFQATSTTVVSVTKCGGVVQRPLDIQPLLTQYFLGGQLKVKSALKTVKFNELKLYRVSKNTSMTSALPAHLNPADLEELRGVKVEPKEYNLTKAVLGVLHYTHSTLHLHQLVTAPLAYFVYVDDVNYHSQTLELLFPNSLITDQQFINSYSILSHLSWIK